MRYYFKLFENDEGKLLSIKENINMVKEELNSEEKFFEKAVMTEKFVNKYKKVIIGSIAAIVVVVAANIAYEANKNSNIVAANAALAKLTKDASNTSAADELKTLSPNLYKLWMLSKAVADKDLQELKELKDSKNVLIGDIASYELSQSADDFSSYAQKQGAIYKDLALVQSAVMLINEGKTQEAHQKLMMVSQQSSLEKIAKALRHYGVN